MTELVHRIRKEFTFEAAHQLETAYTAACHECVHGHSYRVELFLACHALDADGMVLDFSRLAPFKAAIMEVYDHGLMLHKSKRRWYQPMIDAKVLKQTKVTFWENNPTAENIARMLFYKLCDFVTYEILQKELDTNKGNWRRLYVEGVRVHETSTGYAEYGVQG